MTKAVTAGVVLGCMLAAGSAWAHHGASVLGTVRITQPVLAGGERVEPGTYEVRLTGEHLKPLPGQSQDAAAEFELVANGMVVARDFAEVVPAQPAPVGTTGGAGRRLRAQLLRGNEFVRISASQAAEQYLIHLPLAK